MSFIEQVFSTMESCPQHIFQILTKRSERLRELGGKLPWPRTYGWALALKMNG